MPGAGMDVEDAERRRLATQMHEDAREHRVLEHVGEISGVKGVPIVHGAQSCAQMHCCKGVEGPSRASG